MGRKIWQERQEEKMRLRLNKKFYNKGVVKEALEDFKNVCNGKVLNDKIEVELEPREEVRMLKEEFCNYVLGLMKNKTLV